MSTPSSKIYICSDVRLNNDYAHSIWFETPQDQLDYFAGRVGKTLSAYSYIRKKWELDVQVDSSREDAHTWQYLYLTNDNGYRHYFYFINDIEYINDHTVRLYLEMDVIQTYFFETHLLQSFVERQHVENDTVGANTVDEGLELGELATYEYDSIYFRELCILVMSSYDPLETGEVNTATVLASRYGGVFGGLGIYAVPMEYWQGWGAKLNLLDSYGKSDGIMTMWMYPKALVELEDGETWESATISKRVKGVKSVQLSLNRNNKLNGEYTPRNNNLLTYPFNQLYVSNNQGGSASYRFERFGDPSDIRFNGVGALSPEGTVLCYPLNYNREQHAYEYGLTMNNFPTCAWNQDTYKLWLAQNQNTQNLGLITGGATIVAGVGTMAVTGLSGVGGVAGAGMVASGVSQISNILAQRKDMEVQPPQSKGNYSTTINVANNFMQYDFKTKCVTKEYAEIIDGYFDIYGYKINSIQVPNIHTRENWTYVKTVGCHIYGRFCSEDQTQIQRIYDNGITFWTNGDNIGNYSLSNKPL